MKGHRQARVRVRVRVTYRPGLRLGPTRCGTYSRDIVSLYYVRGAPTRLQGEEGVSRAFEQRRLTGRVRQG